jgi:hypothetical protein
LAEQNDPEKEPGEEAEREVHQIHRSRLHQRRIAWTSSTNSIAAITDAATNMPPRSE